jgi:hypothetical protein
VVAFLKRQWILISCGLILLLCTIVDLPHKTPNDPHEWWAYGLHRGYLFYCHNDLPQTADLVELRRLSESATTYTIMVPTVSGPHWPTFGKMPWFYSVDAADSDYLPSTGIDASLSIGLPLWIPFSIVMSWIVIREARWHGKKRTRSESLA